MPNTREATDKMWATRRAKYGKSGVSEGGLSRLHPTPHTPRISKERADATPWGWLRWQLKLTQTQIAELTGARVASVRDWERGKSVPLLQSYIAILRLAKENGLDRSFTARSLEYITEHPTVAQAKKRRAKEQREAEEEQQWLEEARHEASAPMVRIPPNVTLHPGWLRRAQ